MVAVNTFTALLTIASILPSLLAAPVAIRHSDIKKRSHTKRVANKKRCKAKPTVTTTLTATKTTTATATSTKSSGDDSGDSNDNPQTGSRAVKLVWPVDVSDAKNSWSTADVIDKHLKLSDKSLNPIRTNGKYSYTDAPDGTPNTLRAFYQKGGSSPGHSGDLSTGLTIYAQGPTDLTVGDEVLMSYKAYFPKDFDFNIGGKMPGLFGGVDEDVSMTCSGGRHDDGCFSTRMMWRENGDGELYAYLPQNDNNKKIFENVKPKTTSTSTYGYSSGKGSYKWKKGSWTDMAQRVKLNTPGKNDGEIQIWADGEEVMNIKGLFFRSSSKSVVRGLQIETFFGGHDWEWASKKDQYSYFKDFSAAVLS